MPYQPGDRIALVWTSDKYTKLKTGDKGTVVRWHPDLRTLDVDWDSGSTLSMLLGEGDRVNRVLKEEN